ncbi:hypothetical protein U1Q18_052277 [Sarracenia purpurea var. burkii]
MKRKATEHASEGWQNRFRLLMGRNHPDLYSTLLEFQKEQCSTEVTIAELSLGKSVKAAPRRRWLELQRRIRTVTLRYEEYVEEGNEVKFLRDIAHNINL